MLDFEEFFFFFLIEILVLHGFQEMILFDFQFPFSVEQEQVISLLTCMFGYIGLNKNRLLESIATLKKFFFLMRLLETDKPLVSIVCLLTVFYILLITAT